LAACNNVSNEPLPRSMKGYELYSWQEDGQWHFTLITGTNRNKTMQEIISGKSEVMEDGWVNLKAVGVNEIKNLLSRVLAGEWVSWSGGHLITEPAAGDTKLELPPQDIINEIEQHAEKSGLNFHVF
jgi:hypothetical protein